MKQKFIIDKHPAHLPGLFAFESVARHMNFARAAEEMGVTPTAISRTIKLLEAQMQVRLFNRTTRSVGLTEAGAQLLQTLRPALEQISQSVQQVGHDAGLPAGILRVNASYVAYTVLLRPHLTSFLEAYPGIQLDLALDDQLSDVVADGFDAGIRMGHALQRDMIAVMLGSAHYRTVVAAPTYINLYGEPKRPEDLLLHNCIRQRYAGSSRYFEWYFMKADKPMRIEVQGRLLLDEMRAAVEMAIAGHGLAYVFEDFVAADISQGTLQQVLAKFRMPGEAFYLYYPNRAHMPTKLRAFIDYFRNAQYALLNSGN